MNRWQKNFKAVFTIGERGGERGVDKIPKEQLTIEYPFSVNFFIDFGVYSTSATAQFQFINLSENDRARLWLDIGSIGKKYVELDFYAGYGDTMPLIFKGDVMECTSYRESGSTEWITEMNMLSAANFFRYGYLNATFTEGTTLEDILRLAVEGTDLKIGYVTPEIKPLPMNKTFIGQTIDLLGREYGGYNVFVSNNELNILGDNEVVPGEVEVITDSTGLLGTPKRANLFVELETMFAPEYKIAQVVSLLSQSMPDLNGAYKIQQIKHQGLISPSVAGKLTSKITLGQPRKSVGSDTQEEQSTSTPTTTTTTKGDFKEVQKIPEAAYQAPPKNPQWEKPLQYKRISDNYGNRIDPFTKKRRFHAGVDLTSPLNTPVYAASDGKITFTGWNDGYGKYIKIDHGKVNGVDLSSGYGHLNSISVSNGATVTKGQLIGKVGSTGQSTGPHLHFEIRENGSTVNPTKYIRF